LIDFSPSFQREQESSAFVFNDLQALDPSFRWYDEQNQSFLRHCPAVYPGPRR